ncbi:hypothetical protein AMTRI_Chr12g235930 [Amborella trichopoda]
MIILKHHIAETELLLSLVHEEMGDLPLTELESHAFPLLARHAGFLKVVELKDRLGIRQRMFIEISVVRCLDLALLILEGSGGSHLEFRGRPETFVRLISQEPRSKMGAAVTNQ